MPHITESQFKSRFVSLVMGGGSLPKKREDQQILFVSAILALDPQRHYSETEMNDALQPWSRSFGGSFGLDHVTLRRLLIDDGFITRDAAGTSYVLNLDTPPCTYDASIAEIDLDTLIEEARLEREERKRKYMASSDD
jgi:hypothetical protein